MNIESFSTDNVRIKFEDLKITVSYILIEDFDTITKFILWLLLQYQKEFYDGVIRSIASVMRKKEIL